MKYEVDEATKAEQAKVQVKRKEDEEEEETIKA